MHVVDKEDPHAQNAFSCSPLFLLAVNTSLTFTLKRKKMIAFDDAPCIQLSLYLDVLLRYYDIHGKAMTGKPGYKIEFVCNGVYSLH